MKIDLSANLVAATSKVAGANPAAPEDAGDFERLLDEASKPTAKAEVSQESPVEQPQANAQDLPDENPEAQELPQESQLAEAEDSAEVTASENISQSVAVATTPPAVAGQAAELRSGAEEPALQPQNPQTPHVNSTVATTTPVDAEAAAVVTQQVRVDVEPVKTPKANADAKPQAAAQKAAEAAQPEPVATETYKPAVAARSQSLESERPVEASPAERTQPDRNVLPEAAKPQQEQQNQHDDGQQRPPEAAVSAKPQTVEKADAAPQAFTVAPAGAQVEASMSPAAAEAPAPATAISAADVPRPAAPANATADNQPLHAQRQALDEQRVAEQALKAVRSVANQRGGSLTIRLNPPELGELRIRLEMNQHVVSARLEASTDAVRQLLQQQLPQLHSALTSHGLTVDQIQVQTAAPPEGQRGTQDHGAGGDGRSRGSFERQQQRGEQQQDQQRQLSRFERELLDLVA